jgi:hypothetical protein
MIDCLGGRFAFALACFPGQTLYTWSLVGAQ